MSLWRKRGTGETIAPFARHDGQKTPKLFTMTATTDNDLSNKSLWVDPPEGWKYGFPAIYNPDTDGQMSEWIISKGYPIQIIKEYGEQWMVRCWPAEEPH
jgi:hypothetical protein